MFIDSHCHIEKESVFDYVKQSKTANVEKLFNCSFDRKSLDAVIKTTLLHENIYGILGYHPHSALEITEEDLSYLENNIKNKSSKIIGMGEMGLDYYYGKDSKVEQILLFERQLLIAEKYDLPVIIHTRDSIEETYQILKKYKLRGIIHCFNGSLEMANKFIQLGYLIGIGGVLTYKNCNLYKVIEEIELSNIVIETDAPYLAPVPLRGQSNGSWNIPIIAAKISDVKNVSIEEVSLKTTANCIKMFDL